MVVWLSAQFIKSIRKNWMHCPVGICNSFHSEPRNWQVVCTSKDWLFGIACQKVVVGEA
jgi:hypothetical protein